MHDAGGSTTCSTVLCSARMSTRSCVTGDEGLPLGGYNKLDNAQSLETP